MNVGERIKRLRKDSNMTQEELGNLLGVKKAAIQKYESGSIVNLKIETIHKLATIFDVPPAHIMGWDEFDKNYPIQEIQDEVNLIEEIQDRLGFVGTELFNIVSSMDDDGFRKVLFYAEDIQDRYKKSR